MKMRHPFFLACILFLASLQVNCQSKLGDVACVYVTTSNLDSSLAVYEKLGFPKIASNDFPMPWAQVSDGSLLITMRKDPQPYMGLTYYTSSLDQVVAKMEKDSIVFAQKPKQGDMIKRYTIESPDGFKIVLSNNLGGFKQPTGTTLLNMNQADYGSAEKYPNAKCGAFGEFAHPVKDLQKSIVFWKKLGFTVKAEMSAPYPHAILSDGLMIIGLHQTEHFDFPAVSYFGINTAKRIEQLKTDGVKGLSDFMGKDNAVLKTWEGQHFFIFSLGM